VILFLPNFSSSIGIRRSQVELIHSNVLVSGGRA